MIPYVHAAGSDNRITKALRHTGDDSLRIPVYLHKEFLLMEDGSYLLLENNNKIIWIEKYQI